MKNKPNQSEIQLQGFLNHVDEGYTSLQLRPQGDYTAISEAEVNLCAVSNKGKEYLFGGISEGFYDLMVSKYDWREDSVKAKYLINP
jgi:hypothetical protein